MLDHASALLSAFFSRSKTNLADLTGHLPWPLEWRDLAWAVRPTPPQNLRNGIACLWAITSSRYLLALAKGSFRIAKAVSLVFYRPINKYNIYHLNEKEKPISPALNTTWHVESSSKIFLNDTREKLLIIK